LGTNKQFGLFPTIFDPTIPDPRVDPTRGRLYVAEKPRDVPYR